MLWVRFTVAGTGRLVRSQEIGKSQIQRGSWREKNPQKHPHNNDMNLDVKCCEYVTESEKICQEEWEKTAQTWVSEAWTDLPKKTPFYSCS